MNKPGFSFLSLLAVILSTALLLTVTPPGPCRAADCPVPPYTGRNPLPAELTGIFSNAATNRMGSSGPVLPKIYKGYPGSVLVPPYIPCIIINAVGFTESGWRHFSAGFGGSGLTRISADCGYGIMGITSGMGSPDPGYAPHRVSAEVPYNIGTGALFLIQKWNALPYFIGTNNPAVAEDWYYALWAYNGFVDSNNPNHPRLNPDRPPFNGTQPYYDYPYQEIVYGWAANPLTINGARTWAPVPLTLPPRSQIAYPPRTYIDRPLPAHTSCSPAIPTTTRTPTSTPTHTPTPTITSSPTPTRTPRPTLPGLTPQARFPIILHGWPLP